MSWAPGDIWVQGRWHTAADNHLGIANDTPQSVFPYSDNIVLNEAFKVMIVTRKYENYIVSYRESELILSQELWVYIHLFCLVEC